MPANLEGTEPAAWAAAALLGHETLQTSRLVILISINPFSFREFHPRELCVPFTYPYSLPHSMPFPAAWPWVPRGLPFAGFDAFDTEWFDETCPFGS